MDTTLPQQAPVLLSKPVVAAATTTAYFPKHGYISFATANVDAILGILPT